MVAFPKLFKKKKTEKRTGVKIEADKVFDYSDAERREATIRFLFAYAKTSRSSWEEYLSDMKRYYDGNHDVREQMTGFVQDNGLPWLPAQTSDGFIHVETQIDPHVPDFEFAGRDDDTDGVKARVREDVVRYVLDRNPMDLMNTRNERRMNIYGLASWKPAFSMSVKNSKYVGDIVIGNPKPTQLFWDPSATENIDDGEYFAIAYRMHKMAVKREFANDLKRINKNVDNFSEGFGLEDTEFLLDSESCEDQDFTFQVIEWYFKQPEAGQEEIDGVPYSWEAGDIGLVILINQEEIRYVPKYWRKTNCQMYPISVYCKVPNEDKVAGKSELELIRDFIDSTDRQLAYAQLNDAFTAADIVVVEENAMADDCELSNTPGAIIKMKPNHINSFRRLSGLSNQRQGLYDAIDKYRKYSQETNGNFDSFQGNEPSRVTTATGIAILNDRSKARQEIKKVDRNAGFERLLRLIDYTALEYFDDNRLIYLGADKARPVQGIDQMTGQPGLVKQPVNFAYNSDDMNMGTSEEPYYPEVDVKIHVGDGLKNSKAFTIQALQELAKIEITPFNYKFIQAYIDKIDIPDRKELNDFIDQVVQQQLQQAQQQNNKAMPPSITTQELLEKGGFTPEELAVLEQNPDIVHGAAKENGLNITG